MGTIFIGVEIFDTGLFNVIHGRVDWLAF